jgi:hypothetical protein
MPTMVRQPFGASSFALQVAVSRYMRSGCRRVPARSTASPITCLKSLRQLITARLRRPNHAMEPTAGSFGSSLNMQFHPQPIATLCAASRRSSCSRWVYVGSYDGRAFLSVFSNWGVRRKRRRQVCSQYASGVRSPQDSSFGRRPQRDHSSCQRCHRKDNSRYLPLWAQFDRDIGLHRFS